MEKRASPIKIEEELGDTRALIIDNDFPFLTDTLTEKLLLQGCEVDKSPGLLRRYDYIVSLGLSKQLKKTLKKNPDVFPFTKLLKNGGKALFVLSSAQDIPVKKIVVPTLILDTSQTFSALVLANKILKKLFTGHTISIKEQPKKPIEYENDEKKPVDNKSKLKLRLFLVSSILFLFFSPALFFTAGAVSSAYFLSKSIDQNLSADKRKNFIQYAKTSTNITKTTASLLSSLIFPFSERTAHSIEAIGDISSDAASAISEATTIEELLKNDVALIFKNQKTDSFERHIPLYQEKLSAIEKHLATASESSKDLSFIQKVPVLSEYYPITPKIEEARRYANEAREAISLVPTVLAFHGEKNYLLLFQNNFELRPTGGFIGSFALMNVKNGSITKIDVEDVYEADGQLKGHVEPPSPISIYLGQPNWFMRDSNWHPDFLASAQQAEWFLEKELGKTVDGVFAVDLYFVKDLLSSIDGVYVPDYKARVTAQDFFIKLQSDTHDDFFPGSNEKKSLLSSLLSALTIEMKDRSNLPYGSIASSIAKSLTEKHMLLYFHDAAAQKTVEHLGWGGRLLTPPMSPSATTPLVLDYQLVLDANLGVNKANYYIEREFLSSLGVNGNSLERELTIYYKNRSPKTSKLFGGAYKNFVRVLLPKESTVNAILIGDRALERNTEVTSETYQEKTAYGFLVEVPEQTEQKVTIKYSLPIPASKQFSYYLIIQKQPGTDRDPFVFKTKGTNDWKISTSTIPSLPYLSNLSVDRLLSLDFASTNE